MLKGGVLISGLVPYEDEDVSGACQQAVPGGGRDLGHYRAYRLLPIPLKTSGKGARQ